MTKQTEIIFDEATGKFVVHFTGYVTHDDEHKELDRILDQLRRQGFDAEVSHFHDKPKLPELDQSTIPLREEEGGGRQ